MQGDYLVSQIPLEHFDLHLINIVDYRQMTKDLEALWTTITLAISAILLVSMLVAYVLCHKFIFSIENVAAKMNLFDEHHLDVEIRNMSRNELRIIESSFNRMLGQIRGLLDENKQQYKKICEAELNLWSSKSIPTFCSTPWIPSVGRLPRKLSDRKRTAQQAGCHSAPHSI